MYWGAALIASVHPCSEKIATDCLKAANWGVEAAIDLFFTSGLQGAGLDTRAIEAIFNGYKGMLDMHGWSFAYKGMRSMASCMQMRRRSLAVASTPQQVMRCHMEPLQIGIG